MYKVYKMDVDAWKEFIKNMGKEDLDYFKRNNEGVADEDEEYYGGVDPDLLMEDPFIPDLDFLVENGEEEASEKVDEFYNKIDEMPSLEELLEENDNDYEKVGRIWNESVDDAFRPLYKALEISPKTQGKTFDPDSDWYQDYDEMIQVYFSDEDYCERAKYIDFEAFEKAFRNKEIFHPAGATFWQAND